MHLSTVQLLGLPEVLDVFVIGSNFKLMLCPHQVLPPVTQGFHDCQEFPIIDLIVALHLRQGPGLIDHWVPLVVIEMAQYGPIGIV